MSGKWIFLASVVGVAYGAAASYIPCSTWVPNSGTICFRGVNTAGYCNPSTFKESDSCGEKFCCTPTAPAVTTSTCAAYVASIGYSCPAGANGYTCTLNSSGSNACSQSYCCNSVSNTYVSCSQFVASQGLSCPYSTNNYQCSLYGTGSDKCVYSYCCASYPTTTYTSCQQYMYNSGQACPEGYDKDSCVLAGNGGDGTQTCSQDYCCPPATACQTYVSGLGMQCTSGVQYSSCIQNGSRSNRCSTSYCCIGGATTTPTTSTTCPTWISSVGASCPNGVQYTNCVPGGSGTTACTTANCCKEASRVLTECYSWTNFGADCEWPRVDGWQAVLQGYTCFKNADLGALSNQNGIGPCSRDYCCSLVSQSSSTSCEAYPPYVPIPSDNFDWRCDCYNLAQNVVCPVGRTQSTSLCTVQPNKYANVPQCSANNCCLY